MAVYSVKEGRGLSLMGAFGSLFIIIFGVVWTIVACILTAGPGTTNSPTDGVPPGFPAGLPSGFPMEQRVNHLMSVLHIVFPLFGVLFILVGIGKLIYDLYNTTAVNRPSLLDVTTNNEEPDPIGALVKDRLGPKPAAGTTVPGSGGIAQGEGPVRAGSIHSEDIQQRLAELSALRDHGTITDDEFQRQRERILNSI